MNINTNITDKGRAADYMSDHPISVDYSCPLEDALEIFQKNTLEHLPVLDAGRLVGIISQKDLFQMLLNLTKKTPGKRFNEVYFRTEKVSKIMTTDLITLYPDDAREYAVELLLQGRFHSLPVIDSEGFLKGMVKASDLLKGYYEMILNQARDANVER